MVRIDGTGIAVVAPAEVAAIVLAFCENNAIVSDAAFKNALVGDLLAELAAATTIPGVKAVVQKMINRFGGICSSVVTIVPKP